MTEQAKTKSTSLVVIQPTDVRAFFVENKNLDSILAEIETLATNFEPDVSTAKGRKLIGSQAYAVARTKTFIDGLGKELVDAEKEIPKRIDATINRAVIAAIMAADTTITAVQAEAVMKAIVLHKIPNTSIQY